MLMPACAMRSTCLLGGNRRIASKGDFGTWHETFMDKAGVYEAVYKNMRTFGLAEVSERVPAACRENTAKGRLELSDGCDDPVCGAEPS